MNFFNENKSKFQWIPNNVNELRSAVVDCILSKCPNTNQLNFDRVKDNIAFNLRNQIPTLSQYGKDEISDQEIVKAYGEYMSKPGNYGTSTELCIAAEIFDFVGFVLQQDISGNYTCYEFGFNDNSELNQKKPNKSYSCCSLDQRILVIFVI